MADMPGIEELRAQVTEEICDMVRAKVNELTSVWCDVGIDYEPTRSRLERTRVHLSNLLNQMVDGEVDMKERLLKNIAQFTVDVHQLSSELDVPNPAIPDSLTILERESTIRERLEHLKEIKNYRRRERKKLRAKETELCAKLGMPASNLCSASVPSEKDLQELEKHVEALEQEKAVRSCTVSLLRKDIIAKLHLLDAQPQAQLEIQVIDDEDGFILSKDNIDELKAYLDRLKQLEEARRQELAGLLDQLALFFDRLDIPPEEQDRIRSSSNGLTPSILAALRATLAEYERQKKERLREFVIRAKDDLLTWYKKCCVPQSRVYLDEDDSEDISEERLALLEEQLKALKEFYSENKMIIAKAERHDALWSRSLELEKLATDPSRLTNRGGRLLLEAKERQRLQVEIPRLRKEIEKFITTYSGSNKIFAVWGKDFLEHLDAQQQAHAQEKERERLERESRRKATPSALGSSKRAYCGTPSSSASKMSRLGTSSATLASSRRLGTPVGKGSLAVRGGTPVGAAVRSIRRRSLKTQQKKLANGRQLFSNTGAEGAGPSTSTGAPLGGVSTMDSFAQFLAQQNEKQLTSSVLFETPGLLRPEAAEKVVQLDVTLVNSNAPSS
ncbi:protein regulator of cytokinesis 1 [Rhipicephalus sanguineus]|uniref:protein regulator of cytokinesis 1 n=1 Tax=Rhipicephalus sanguineus TaxID=34632 RepID=UPI0018950CB4|nr:protein regulator of cytokinesis 1 [Rhipicephalus sanguineus]